MKKIAIDELRRVKGKGLLQPAAVVMAAKAKSSPLHPYFTWDDRKAAQERRMDQARELIQAAVEIDPALGEPVRVFVSLSTSRSRGGGYHETAEVLDKAALRRIYLMDALREIEGLRQRYAHLNELAPVFAAASQVRTAVTEVLEEKRRTKAA